MAFYFSPARLCVPPYFVQNSCDISVHAELNGDGWLVFYLSFLSLVIRLSFFPHAILHYLSPQSADFYLTGTLLHASHPLPFQTGVRLFVTVSLSPLLTLLKGVPERFCPTFGASAVLRGRHLLSKRLREQRPSHFCPVQQGKYENNLLVIHDKREKMFYQPLFSKMALTDTFSSL